MGGMLQRGSDTVTEYTAGWRLACLLTGSGCLYVAAAQLGLGALSQFADTEVRAEISGAAPPDNTASVEAYQQSGTGPHRAERLL